jgi:hypothetical protein
MKTLDDLSKQRLMIVYRSMHDRYHMMIMDKELALAIPVPLRRVNVTTAGVHWGTGCEGQPGNVITPCLSV